MNEYLSELYNWISSQDNTFQGRRSKEEFISKMQNDSEYNQKMYSWISGVDDTFKNRYTTEAFQSKTGLKKKDELQSTSPKVVMESITEDENQSFLSDFIEKNEEEAKPLLEKKLTEKGFSVQQTGIGNALLVTDNVTGEETEVDLKPIKLFGANKEEEISKVKKLIETPIDNRRKLLSTNNKSFFDRDVDSYIESLKNKFPNFSIQNFDDENIVISKGDKSQVIKVKDIERGVSSIREGSSTPDVVSPNSKAFKEINKFIYNNITDDESSSIIDNFNVDTLKNIDENLKNIESKVDVSIESAEANVYNKDYFKGLFQFLDSSNVDIPQDVRNELEKGTKLKVFTTRNGITSREIPLSREEIDSALNQYFYNDLDTKKKIEAYNLSKTVSSRKEKIDRAKKLKIEVLYDSLPNKEEVKEVIRQKNKEITEEELDIQANLKMASSDISNMVKSLDLEVESMLKENPDVTFKTILDDKGNVVDIVSDKPSEDLEKLKKRVSSAILNYEALAKQSKYKLDKIAANKKTTEEFLEAANKNYDLFDTAMADLKNALVQMGGGAAIMKTLVEGVVEDAVGMPISLGITQPVGALPADVRTDLIRGTMNESRENLDKFYKTKRMYDESIKEGSLGEFSIRTFFEQSPNLALAIGTSGVAPSLGLGKLGTQLLIGTEFGLTSAGQKYDDITTRQEFGKIAKKGLEELESIKGVISDEEYLVQKYELERALKDSEISSKDKTLSVLGTGIVEGGITAFLGTAPNSIKILRDLKKPTQFLDDILVSNYKAASKTLKELGKRTGGEIVEETSIDVLTQVNDYMFLNDQIDLSSLDDVAVTSIITSGAMNTPSTAYSTILTQVNVNRYKNKIKGITDQVQSLKNMLMNPDLTDIQRNSIHDSINSSISQIAEQTTEMEGDAMLLGSENIKEMITLSSVRNSMLKKAGVENDDSYDIARTKIDNYLSTLSESESKNFVDQMKFIDSKRNDILSKINYEGAIERVFGDKGSEIAKTLDKTLTPKQKYVEVYKQVRQEINDNALKEFIDAIQKQEAGDIPDAQPAEGVQEMEEEVRKPAVEEETLITPETSSNYANLTEDDEGNFVFYHVGSEGYSQVKPKSGATKATSGEERAALSKVGGMAMYYTKANDGESMVSGSTKYEVKVPKDKVYDFNSDPLNLKKEAKERHDAENPGKGYDNNSELAYVAKIAEEKGFDMVVAEWDGKTRAQTTKALVPNDTQVREGNTIVKPFKNQYKSNADKGFVSVIPESKQSKLEALYNKIYKERNKQNKYDDLYRLQENSVKMSQEEITDLIEGSDISQEIKNEYKQILESEEGKRKSVNKKDTEQEEGVASEPADMPNAPKGVFLDIEMIAGKDGRKMSEGEIIDALPFDEVEVDNDGTNLRVKIPRKLSNSEMMTLMKATQQEAIGQVVDGKGVLHAQSKKLLADYGNMFNPEYFKLPRELRKVAKNSNINKLREKFGKKDDGSGRPSIDEVRKFAKENNIPEADTRAYLKELGYTQDEIATKIEKEEDIYVKKGNKVVDWLKKTKRYLLSAKGFLPKNVFIAKEKKDQLISTEISIAERTAKRLNKLLKNQSEEVLNEVNNLMNGKKFSLPKEIALVAKQMREHIDSLSIKLVESGAVKSSESIENIKNNLGSYLNRSYRVFDDKNWASKVSEEVVQKAKQYLKNSWYNQESKLKMAEELSEKQGVSLDEWINKKVDQETNDIIKQKEANSFIVAATEGSKNLKVLKQRKEIPAEIRALMGEYNDPAYNYVVSVAKIINIVENQKFLEKIKDIGDGVFLFKEGEIRRGEDTRYVKVAAESNESLAPLNGYYMPKEIAEQLKSQDLITLKESWFKKLYSGWLKSVAGVKKSKTIYSVGTHGKNVFGNARFMAQNGYLNLSDYNNAFKVLKNQFKDASDNELNELLDKYKKLGVINQSVNLNEIRSMFSSNDSFDIRIEKRMLEQTENKTYKNAKQKLKNIDKFLEDMYQAEDDLFKIVAYENEKRDYSDILYNKKYEELTETEKQNVDDYVSNIVKNILPNYSRIGNLGKGLKFIPVTGTFISFQIEAYRTAYNTVGLAINEIKSDNAKMRTKGAKRLVSLMAVEGLKQSLLYFLGASFLGDDDEEEKINANDVRPFLPEWAKNSDIIVTSLGDGKFSYVNVSASDPYGGIFQILNAAARGEDMSESITGALKEFGDPILSQDIFLSAIDDIVRNKTQYGGDLIEAGDDIFDKTGKITERLWTAFEPGTLTSIRKIMKSKEGAAYETIGQFTGLKPHTVDVEKILNFKLKDIKDDISEIKKEQYRAEYKIIDTGELGDLFEAYNNVDKKLDPVFKDANNSVKKAMRLGVSIYNIDKILTQKRFSNEDASLILFYDNLK